MSGTALINKMNTSDILCLLEYLGVSEQLVRYGNESVIFPTVCHNELISAPSHKLYYYESTKKFYCYTNCKGMDVFEFIINAQRARGNKYTFSHAYNLMSSIVNNRMRQGFAVIEAPKMKRTPQIVPNWQKQLTVYNHHVLECFTQQPKYLAPWLDEGISYDVLCDFGVRFDMVRNRIVFPVYDHIGRLIGVKARNFNIEDIEAHRKYMPLWYNKELYNYPKMMVLYGYYQNRYTIKKAKEAIVFESEKAVLQYGSFFTLNKAVAIGGSSFSVYHGQILKDCGVETIVLALDYDWDDDGNKDYGLHKMIREGYKIQEMGFNVELIYDWDDQYLGDKDSPIDRGRVTFTKLYRARKNLTTFATEVDEKEDDGEIPTTNEEL